MNDPGLAVVDEEDLRKWAARTINTENANDLGRLRSDILRRLESHDFVPHEEWLDAINVLIPGRAPASSNIPATYRESREEILGEEVQRFAETFFDQEPTVRRQIWEQLSQRCVLFPPLRIWLSRLEAGLDVVYLRNHHGAKSSMEFGQVISGQFLQIPGAAGHACRQMLAKMREDRDYWRPVAIQFRRLHFQVAQLCPATVSEFADLAQHRRRESWLQFWNSLSKGWIPQSTQSDMSSKETAFTAVVIILISVVGLSTALLSRKPTSDQSRSFSAQQSAPKFDLKLSVEDYHRIKSAKPEELKQGEHFLRILIDGGEIKLVPKKTSEETPKPVESPLSREVERLIRPNANSPFPEASVPKHE